MSKKNVLAVIEDIEDTISEIQSQIEYLEDQITDLTYEFEEN